MKEDIISFYSNEVEDIPFCIEMAGISYCDGTYRLKRSNSPIYVFEFILKGQGTVIIDNEKFTPVEGDIYILPRGSNHRYFSDDRNPWEKIWFNIRGTLVDHLMQAYRLNGVYHIKGLDLKKLFFKFLSIAQSSTDSTEEIFGKAAIVFHEILSNIYERIHTAKAIVNPEALSLKEYVDKQIMHHINLKELGDYIHKSPSQTIRIFKKEFGITPYEYLMNMKIETAKLMLLNTKIPVNEIAFKLSFADEHYFSNYFKAKVGMSPKNFRNKI